MIGKTWCTVLVFTMVVAGCQPSEESTNTSPSVVPSAKAEAEVRAAVVNIYAALSAKDANGIEPYIKSDGYSEFAVTGGLLRLDMEYLRSFLTGEMELQAEVEDLKVETYGDAAVVTGYRVHSFKMPDGSIDEGTQRLSMVWARLEGHWKVLHVHLPPSSEG
ncbi:MAG: nuclear transport factor 2 family protein [Nitrospinaceae bacterium]|nr:nuclear transport factor 2 family protein [Nitrospinaceae bacterium]